MSLERDREYANIYIRESAQFSERFHRMCYILVEKVARGKGPVQSIRTNHYRWTFGNNTVMGTTMAATILERIERLMFDDDEYFYEGMVPVYMAERERDKLKLINAYLLTMCDRFYY